MIDTMAAFSVKALASKPLDCDCVLHMYRNEDHSCYSKEELIGFVRQLALSHERLRQELLGAEQLILESIEGRNQLKRQGFPV
jgi:hypothetical protein